MEENSFVARRRRPVRSVVIIVLVIGVALLAYGWYQVGKPFGGSELGATVDITVEEGMGQQEIGELLAANEVIDSAFFFRVYTVLSGKRSELRAGEYAIGERAGIKQAVSILTSPPVGPETATITLIEGWRADQMVDYLAEQGLETDLSEYEDLVEAGEIDSEEVPSALFAGKPEQASFEGYLFPDTYEVYRDVAAEDLIVLQLATLAEKLLPVKSKTLKKYDLTLFEVITLASIVEREVSDPADRRVVAGIFLERLSDSYPLQSDATVNYVTGKKTTRPSLDDLEVDSRYNTYAHNGLPPGPISNPSIDSIEAVLNPTASDYYFFLTTLEGETIFSKTFDEHLVNKRKYYPN